ncbi:MAG: phage terminase large subunit family protein [Bacteroidota bacterium]
MKTSFALLTPPPKMTVSEWADEKRILSAETASEPGKYRLSRAPYQAGMMDATNEIGVEEVTYMTSTRSGKTTGLENVVGYFVDYDPSPLLYILPNEGLARRWSKLNLAPMVRDNPTLQEKVADEKSRSGDNEILYKAFYGGHIVIGGANAPASLSMYSMRVVLFDEVDKFPVTAGIEGDPVELGKQRAANFLNRLYIYASTPTIRGLSRIEASWNESDQRHFFVPCPHCNEMQILIFGPRSQFAKLASGFLKYTHQQGEVKSAVYVCGKCKKDIPERHKQWMLRRGEWRKMRPQVKAHAGFHISQLYSPWVTWKEIARDFLKTEKRRDRYKVFVNTRLGETFIENANYQYDESALLDRRETYENIPLGVVLLTVGVDVQDDRLEAVVIGWGIGEESWLIDWAVLPGSPDKAITWKLLDDFLTKNRKYENGFPSVFGKLGGILSVGVDSGDNTKSVYEYVKRRAKQRFFALKGNRERSAPFVKYSRSKKIRTPLVLVNVHTGKKTIYERLSYELSADTNGEVQSTPGYMHFNMMADKDYFEQLTSEQLRIRTVKGYPVQEWVLPEGKRNEKLDATNYALAALSVLNVNLDRRAQELQIMMLSTKHDPVKETTGTTTVEPEQSTEPDRTPPTRPIVQRTKRLRMRMK